MTRAVGRWFALASAGTWAALLMAAYVVLVLPSVGQTLLETHAFRQTQTAYTAFLFARNGIDLLHPPLPVLGPPGTVPLEFPLFQLLGSGLISLGIATDPAMRLTGLASFIGTAWLVFLVARRLLSGRAALIALAAFLFNPHALLYGRTSLIEYLATAGGLLFVLFAIRWLDAGRARDWLLALVGAAAVLLVKVTTGPIFLLPILAWRTSTGGWAARRPLLWVLFAVAGGIGFAWSQHADAVRSSSPATAFLAATNSLEWFFGTLEMRISPGAWRVPLVALLALTGSGIVAWAILAVKRARQHAQRTFVIAVLVSIILPVLVLFNLYAIHDYYYAAVAPFIAIAIGLGVDYLLSMPKSRTRRRLLVALAGAWIATFIGMIGSWTLIYGTPEEEAQLLASAEYIREHSSADDWIVVEGLGWNSAFLYYAERRGFADPTGDNLLEPGDLDVDAILSDPIYGPFFTCDPGGSCTVSETR